MFLDNLFAEINKTDHIKAIAKRNIRNEKKPNEKSRPPPPKNNSINRILKNISTKKIVAILFLNLLINNRIE